MLLGLVMTPLRGSIPGARSRRAFFEQARIHGLARRTVLSQEGSQTFFTAAGSWIRGVIASSHAGSLFRKLSTPILGRTGDEPTA